MSPDESHPHGPSITPRPEAGILGFPLRQQGAAHYQLHEEKARPQLTAEQIDVADRVQGLINAMANWKTSKRTVSGAYQEINEDEPEIPSFLPRIEPQRESRVVVIDGTSGSGKTSVLLTLIDFWGRQISEQQGPAPGSGLAAPIFPIGFLDLQSLPPSTNLILHVASTLRKVIETIDGEMKPGTSPPPWHPVRQQELQSRTCWREFVKVAVAGSDGNLQLRRDLDPEALALELEQTERERLDVAKAFYRLVDALGKDLARGTMIPGNRPPLLILSIDDADMNPHFSVALLNLLRSLYHPRLAYVLTGNSDLFITMLRMHFFDTVFRPVRGISLSSTEMGEIQRASDRLARLTYDRLVPDRQRCRIEDLDAQTRLQQLSEALDRVDVSTYNPIPSRTIRTYFDLVPQVRLALPNRMRGIVDVRAQLNLRGNATGEWATDGRLAARLVKHLWDRALRAMAFPQEDLNLLESRVQITDEGYLRVEPNNIYWDPVRRSLFPISSDRIFTAHVYRPGPLGALLRIPDQAARPLAPATVAAFMLANIVAVDGIYDAFVSPRTTELPPPFELTLMSVEFDRDDTGRLSFGWPLPHPMLLLDIMIISDCWKAALETRDAPATIISQLAVFFLEVVLKTASTRTPKSEVFRTSTTGAEAWDALAGKLANLMHLPAGERHTTRALRFTEWARERAGLLAAPESGLPPKIARTFLKALEEKLGSAEWPNVAAALEAARLVRAEHALRANQELRPKETDFKLGARQLLDEIDNKCPDSEWKLVKEAARLAKTLPSKRQEIATELPKT